MRLIDVRTGQTAYWVSIHAPERGATPRRHARHHKRFGFNPRTRAGCDFHFGAAIVVIEVSIHAPERGATTGGRPEQLKKLVSIHAPERGATQLTLAEFEAIGVSIHAPERGATIHFAPG